MKNKITKNLFKTFLVIAITIFLTLPLIFNQGQVVLAQNTQLNTGLDDTADAAGLKNDTPFLTILGNVVYIILGFLGIIFILLLIYGGFMRMTANGDANKISKSMQIIKGAIYGVIIILASYAITAFVFGNVGASINVTP